MRFLSIDIDPVTIAVLVFMLLAIFLIAGATVTIDQVTPSGNVIANQNNTNTPNNSKATTPQNTNEPDKAYLSPKMREHILLEQSRYYTDSCDNI